jgi:hypothetical protein
MGAKNMTKDEALAELVAMRDQGLILFEDGHELTPSNVWLEGWSPDNQAKEVGNVAGVIVTFLNTGTLTVAVPPRQAAAPDALDARNALALVRFCQWLRDNFGVHTLYHLGISGDSTGARTDCHGQGRAIDFVGVAGNFQDVEYGLTVLDNWSVDTPATPGGAWPDGTGSNTHYRLDEPDQDPFTAQFFRDAYDFITGEWQDHGSGPDDVGGSAIGEGSFVMNPDHPTSAPGTPHGREAHQNHLHMQIGVTGTA